MPMAISKMIVQYKKLMANAREPLRMSENANGYDLTAMTGTLLENGLVEYDTGIAVAIPQGYVGLLFPRSSISKTGWRLANSVGVIDSDYRGSIRVRFRADKALPSLPYKIGERVAQLVILPAPEIEFEEADSLDQTDRGAGGFGSTDT